MAHHDPQSTGRSKLPGPILGKKAWDFGKENEFFSGVTIGPDSTIYAVSNDTLGNALFVFKPNGELKFTLTINQSIVKTFTAPLLRKDGSIIFYDGLSSIFAVKKDGTLLWEYKGNFYTRNKTLNIDKDGNLYFISYPNQLIVLTPDGKLSWALTDERIAYASTLYMVTFSPDGNTLYIPGSGATVIAVDISNKKIKWTYGETASLKTILVDSDGNLYFEKPTSNFLSTFVSLTPAGKLRWETDFKFEEGLDTAPTIDKLGNFYFGSDTLYSVDYFGELKWKIGLVGRCDAPIVCDEFGTIYVTTTSTTGVSINIYAISSNGNIRWIFTNEGTFGTNGSAAIGFNESMIVPVIYNGKLLYIN
jgi:hypothetical protein